MNLTTLAKGMLYLCLAFLSTTALAQNKVITGKVTDAKDGSAVQSASVLVKGAKLGTQTAQDGTFKLSVPSDATTIVISSLGFGTQTVSIQGKTSVEVGLKATSDQLGDVVVIGYGTARKKDVTGAVASVQAKDFNQGIAAAPDQLLQNKVAGVEITQTNGQPVLQLPLRSEVTTLSVQ